MNELKAKINDILFNFDPANTYCKENDIFNEYAKEAEEIALEVANGKLVFDAVREVFDKSFGGHVEVDFHVIAEIEAEIMM